VRATSAVLANVAKNQTTQRKSRIRILSNVPISCYFNFGEVSTQGWQPMLAHREAAIIFEMLISLASDTKRMLRCETLVSQPRSLLEIQEFFTTFAPTRPSDGQGIASAVSRVFQVSAGIEPEMLPACHRQAQPPKRPSEDKNLTFGILNASNWRLLGRRQRILRNLHHLRSRLAQWNWESGLDRFHYEISDAHFRYLAIESLRRGE
jgi:hypothetical protein